MGRKVTRSRWFSPRALWRALAGAESRRRPRRSLPLCLESLEERLAPAAQPIDIGSDPSNMIELRLSSSNGQWTQNGNVYLSPSGQAVNIGLKPATASGFVTILTTQDQVAVDTFTGKFTLKAPINGDDNFLYYTPGGNAVKQAKLFAFSSDYAFVADQLVSATGQTVTGTALDPKEPVGLTAGPGSLTPNMIRVSHTSASDAKPLLTLNGQMNLTASSPGLVQSFLKNVGLDFSKAGTYSVSADAAGNVNVVTASNDSGGWVNWVGSKTFTLGPVQFTVVAAQFQIDTTTQTVSVGGQFTVGLKDDDPDTTTPFLVQLGDRTTPGLTLHYDPSATTPANRLYVTHFQAALMAGTSGGKSRAAFSTSAWSIGLSGLYVMYDQASDSIGIAGTATAQFVAKPGGGYQNSVTLQVGDYKKLQAGVKLDTSGTLLAFSGKISGSFTIGKVFNVTFDELAVAYARATASTPTTITISGQMTAGIANLFSVSASATPAAPITWVNGSWSVGSVSIAVNSGFDVSGLGIQPRNLQIGYSIGPKNADTWTFKGGVTLPKLWNATLTFNAPGGNPGLVVSDGQWKLNGFQFSIDRATIGGAIGLTNLSIDFESTASGWSLKVAGTVVLPGGIAVGCSFQLKDGKPVELGVQYTAVGSNPGIPVGDTGLFITSMGLELDDLYSQNLVVLGEVAVGYGEPVNGVRVFTAQGHFKADKDEFDITSAGYKILGGVGGSGTGSLTLNWAKHQYSANIDVFLYGGLFEVQGSFYLNQFGQITVFASVSLEIPNWVPFIGGLHLASLEGLFYWDPVNPANSKLAAWLDIDLIFTHLRGGLEWDIESGNVHWIGDGDIQNLEAEATQDHSGYKVDFPAATIADGTQANQGLFSVAWDTPNELADVSISVPGQADKITLPLGDTSAHQFTTADGNKYDVMAVPQLSGQNRYQFVVAADMSNPYADIPTGSYMVTATAAEKLDKAKLTVGTTTLPPVIKSVSLDQQPGSNQVTVNVNYGTADPNKSKVTLYYATDPGASSGTAFASISLNGDNNQGTVSTTWDMGAAVPINGRVLPDISPLSPNQPYYVYATIEDADNPAAMSPVSATTAELQPDLVTQIKLTPDVPIDQEATTLSDWPVVWQELDANGKPVDGKVVYSSTDGTGRASLYAEPGTSWTVTVAPANWDGFAPVTPPGQTPAPNSQTIFAAVQPGTAAAPVVLEADYQNTISVQGLVSLDLAGTGQSETGGAGLADELVWADVNGNGQFDPATDPFTNTDLGGFYDLRIPLPTQDTNYVIHLMPDASAAATFVRTNIDWTSDFTFTEGSTYTIGVAPLAPHLQSFVNRDFLIDQNYVISGTAYVSGTGSGLTAGAHPASGKTITIVSAAGASDYTNTTTTAADGSYSFVVPSAGQYVVSAADQAPAVTAPTRYAFATDPSAGNLPLSLPVKTPSGAPLYQLGGAGAAPYTVSGDFNGDGNADVATLAVDAPSWTGGTTANLYLVIYKGATARAKLTTQVVLLASNVSASAAPSLYWSPALGVFVAAAPAIQGGVAAVTYNPKTAKLGTVAAPTSPADLTTLLGVSTGGPGGADVWLLSGAGGSSWALLKYTNYGQAPTVLASFTFGTSNGLRPALLQGGEWAGLVQGDFDGDGVPDYAFSATGLNGQSVIGYVLSKENFAQAHTYNPGGSSGSSNGIASLLAVTTGNGAQPAGALSDLAVTLTGSGGDELLVLAPVLAPAVTPNPQNPIAAASFRSASLFPLAGHFTGSLAADVTGDGYLDLILSGPTTFAVLANQGGGSFAAPAYAPVQGQLTGAFAGLLSAGASTGPAPGGKPTPSFLFVQQSAGGSALSLQLLNNTTQASNSYVATLISPGSYGGYDFGYVSAPASPAGTVSGVAFTDSNGNGVQDPGEPNLVGQPIALTQPTGGSTVVTLSTNAIGRYSFSGAGTSSTFQATGQAPLNTAPKPPDASYTLNAVTAAVTGYDFGAYAAQTGTGSLQGVVVLDDSGTGAWTPTDRPLAGVTVYIDLNGDGVLDARDPRTTTNANGAYHFDGLAPGSYVVSQVVAPGARQVFPTQAVATQVLAAQTSYGVNFVDTQPSPSNQLDPTNRPDVVPVGQGSYTTDFPNSSTYPEYTSPGTEDYHAPSTVQLPDSSPSSTFPYVTPGSPTLDNPNPDRNKPLTTSEWWSSLLFRRSPDTPFSPMSPGPLSLLASPDGLGMAYVNTPVVANVPPGDPRGPGTQYFEYEYPQEQDAQGNFNGVYKSDLTVGLAELTSTDPASVTVYDYTDWTVTADWSGQLRATAGEGLPYVYYTFPQGGDATVTFGDQDQVTLISNANGAVLVKVAGTGMDGQTHTHYYGLFGPTELAANWDTSAPSQYVLRNLTAATGFLSVAVMPDNFDPTTPAGQATFELFREHAYNFVTGAQANPTFTESTGQLVTQYALTTQFMDTGSADGKLDKTAALQALYPTQYLYLSSGSADAASTYAGPRGAMRLLTGDAFATTLQYQGALPYVPDVAETGTNVGYHDKLWNEELLPYLRMRSGNDNTDHTNDASLDLANLIRGDDVYAQGQSMLGAAQLIPLLVQVSQALSASGNVTWQAEGALAGHYAQQILQILEDNMGAWLSANDDNKVQFFYYDQNFDALLAVPGAYESSDSVNDQHLGLGYFVKTAALIAQYDPAWAQTSQMGGMVNLLVNEVANPDRNPLDQTTKLPYLRNFDPYAGHSWADGAANSANGNNQESSSEALNFASGLIAWGQVTGNTQLLDTGVYLYTTELTSVNDYYFNQDNPQNPAAQAGVTRPQISIIESTGGEYQTFFGNQPEIVTAIQFLPFTGSSYYLADAGQFRNAQGQAVNDTGFIARDLAAASIGDQTLYQNPLNMLAALQGQAQAQKALAYLFAADGTPNFLPFDGAPGTPYSANNGVDNPAFNYDWLSVLATYGRPDTTVTADTTSYTVFVSDTGTRTYVAYNPGADPLAVTFSDGYVLNVPAHSLKTSAGQPSNAPAGDGDATPAPDFSLKAPTNRLFLAPGDPSQPSQGTFTVGTAGTGASTMTVLGANNGSDKNGLVDRLPPNAQAVTFTMAGINGTVDSSKASSKTPVDFSVWLDGGVIPNTIDASQVGFLFQVFNNGGGNSSPDYSIRYAPFVPPSSSPTGIVTGYTVAYTQGVGGGAVETVGQLPATLTNATVRVTLFNQEGLTPVIVRVGAAAEQGRVSYVDLPYTVTSTAPAVVALTTDSTSITNGAKVTLTATVTAVGDTPPQGQVVFYNDGQPIGTPMRLALPETANGYSSSSAMLVGFSGLPVGTNHLTAQYYGLPSVSGVSATQGGTGQIVTINGVNLAGATAVTFGGTAAASFTIDSPYQITAVVGAGAKGAVQVTTLGGVATASASFTYLNTPAPTMSGYTPASAGPGAVLTIQGSHLSGVTSVTIGGVAATINAGQSNDTQVSVIIANSPLGAGPIVVTTPGGTASSANLSDPNLRSFLLGGGGPNISGLSAEAGAAGTQLVISGQSFVGVTQVTVGGTPVSSYTADPSTTQITAVVGSGTTGQVQVTTGSGSATSWQVFTIANGSATVLTSPPLAVTVSLDSAHKATPTVTVSSSQPAVVYGNTDTPLTFTAAVYSGTGTPTGGVTFRLGDAVLATVPLSASGTAVYSPDKPLLPGTYQLRAEYTGDPAFADTASKAFTLTVQKANVIIESVDAVGSPAINAPVILRATLKPEGNSDGVFPAGTIEFHDGAALLGYGSATFQPGVFTFTTTLAPGQHNIRVFYPGDSLYNYAQMPAQGFLLTVLPAGQTQGVATTTTVTAMVNDPSGTPKSLLGQPVFFNATVAVKDPPAGFVGFPTGQVTLQYQYQGIDGNNPEAGWHDLNVNPSFLLLYYTGQPNLNQSLVGQLPAFSPSVPGFYHIQAVYQSRISFGTEPNPQFQDSTSAPFTLDVVPPDQTTENGLYPTQLTLTAEQSPGLPADTTLVNESVVLTATVTSPNSWGNGAFGGAVTGPDGKIGNVQFYKDGAAYGGLIPVNSAGQATFIVTSLPVGTTSWTAQFMHLKNSTVFEDSPPLKTPVKHTIAASDPAKLSVSVTSSANPAPARQPVTFTVTVAGQSARGLGVPGGQVQVKVVQGGVDFGGVATLDATGQATFTTSQLGAGTYTVTAVYNGDKYDKYFPTGAAQNTSAPLTLTVTPPTLLGGGNDLPPPVEVKQDTSVVLSNAAGTALQVSGFPADGRRLLVTLTAQHGSIRLATTAGLRVIAGGGLADGTISFSGTPDEINRALDGLRFTPASGFTGQASVTITTAPPYPDNGTPAPAPAQDVLPITVFAPPRLTALGTQTGDQGRLLKFTATATPAPGSAGPLVFSLDPGAPAGASINPATGAFTWTPAAPGVFRAVVRVTVGGHPLQTATETVTLVALPVVRAVTLNRTAAGLISGLTVYFGSAVAVLPGAFAVGQVGGPTIPVRVTMSPNGMAAVLTFTTGRRAGPGALPPPGPFALTVRGGLIRDAASGLLLDAAGNLLAGSDGKFVLVGE